MRQLRPNRGRLLGVAVVVALIVLLGALAGAARGTSRTQTFYLALGDSITYGFQPTKSRPGVPASAFRTGYVDVFAARLRKLSPQLEVINYGCPGESTVTFTRGGWNCDGKKLHDAFKGSQLKAALAFLRAHPGEVSPVTLTLWGNDWFPFLLDTCKGKAACVRARGPSVIASIGSRLTSILRQLRALAPTAEIVVTGAWNPDPNQLTQLKPIYRSLDASIARAAIPSHARVAKMLPVFNPPRNGQARLCAFTFICSKGDPHPTDAGYRAMADAVLRASG